MRCSGVKQDGGQCTATVNPPQSYCWWHDPKNSEKRHKAAASGGRAKAQRATKELHTLLEDLTQRVIDGELETSRGAVANQLISTRIRLLEYERRLKELQEIEERLQQLEELTQERKARGSRG